MIAEIVITACREKLAAVEKEIARLDYMISMKPITRLNEIRREAGRLIREKGHEAPETLAFITKHMKEEGRLRKIMKDQIKNGIAYIDLWIDLKMQADHLAAFIASAEWQNSRGRG